MRLLLKQIDAVAQAIELLPRDTVIGYWSRTFKPDDEPDIKGLARHLIFHGDAGCPIDRTLLSARLAEWMTPRTERRKKVIAAMTRLSRKGMGIDPLTENWVDLQKDILWEMSRNKRQDNILV